MGVIHPGKICHRLLRYGAFTKFPLLAAVPLLSQPAPQHSSGGHITARPWKEHTSECSLRTRTVAFGSTGERRVNKSYLADNPQVSIDGSPMALGMKITAKHQPQSTTFRRTQHVSATKRVKHSECSTNSILVFSGVKSREESKHEEIEGQLSQARGRRNAYSRNRRLHG